MLLSARNGLSPGIYLSNLVLMSSIFWDTTQSLQSACYLLHAGFLLCLFFNPEEESDMFL
jgi:hypothetical protein